MAIATNGPTTGQTTLYPLPMIQDHSLVGTHMSVEVTNAAAAGEILTAGVYVLSWELKHIARLPGSKVTFACDTIGVQTVEFPEEITLLPRQQYFLGFLPSTDLTLRVTGLNASTYVLAGTELSGVVALSSKQADAWVQAPWAEVLSKLGNEVL